MCDLPVNRAIGSSEIATGKTSDAPSKQQRYHNVSKQTNFGYYRGLYSTILDEYFVTIEVQCGGEERLQKLLSSAVSFNPKSKQ